MTSQDDWNYINRNCYYKLKDDGFCYIKFDPNKTQFLSRTGENVIVATHGSNRKPFEYNRDLELRLNIFKKPDKFFEILREFDEITLEDLDI